MNEEAIFHQALALSLPEERAAYLEQACAGDPALRESIESLLKANEGASSFLFGPAPALRAHNRQPGREGSGTVIGPYKLLEKIGEGGMGVVYMAEQTVPVRRKVALKIIKPGMDTRHVIARFEAERQALALMEHPNIARVLDAGSTESGRPYFVMELVRGIPITDYCDGERLSIDERLDLFVVVCQAVQHAHQQGIIHRDIKPSNVLITLHDGVPVPKIIDFGIAKATGQQLLTDKTLFTGFAQLMGTPLYMSPEQAALSGIDVDIRSDIYSLGVLLYELLTGTTPFDKDALQMAALDEVWRIIREEDPPTPSTRLRKDDGGRMKDGPKRESRSGFWPFSSFILHPSSFQELDWIVMKSLEKDRSRRYETASAFAADVARYQADQPVEAGPPSAWYCARKFARRHRLGLAMAAIVAMSSMVVAGVWTWSAIRLDRARRAFEKSQIEVERRATQARQHRYAGDVRQAHQLWAVGEGVKAQQLLQNWRPKPGERDVREFAWHYVMRLCHDERRSLSGHNGAVYHAGFSPDGRTIVSCGQDGTVRFWDFATGAPLRMIPGPDQAGEVNSAEFSPDGRLVATASDDGKLRLWDAATCALQATIPAHTDDAYVTFTRDGRRLVSGGRKDHLVKLWDVATREQVASVKASDNLLESAVISPDGKTLATAGDDGCFKLWNLADLTPRKSVPVLRGPVYGLAFSRDGTRLATADGTGRMRVWDCPEGEPRKGYRGYARIANDAQAVAFLAGDRMLVSGHGDASVRLLDAADGRVLGWLQGHTKKIWGISVSPDGRSLATASDDGTAKLWDARLPERRFAIPAPSVRSKALAFTPDGRTLIVADIVGGKEFAPPDGTMAYAADADLEVRGLDPETGAERFHRVLDRAQKIHGPALSSDGVVAVLRLPGGTATAWEVATGRRLGTFNQGYSFIPVDSSLFVVKPRPGGPFELVDVSRGPTIRVLRGTEGFGLFAVALNLGIAAVQTRDGSLAIWDLATNRARCARPWHWSDPTVAAFSPDASILAIGDASAVIHLFDANTLELLATMPGHSQCVVGLEFSPDGRTLVSRSSETSVKLWDVTAGEELLTLIGPYAPVSAPRFSPEGRTLAFFAEYEEKHWIVLLKTGLPKGVDSEEGP